MDRYQPLSFFCSLALLQTSTPGEVHGAADPLNVRAVVQKVLPPGEYLVRLRHSSSARSPRGAELGACP